jgi:hypothetical protein
MNLVVVAVGLFLAGCGEKKVTVSDSTRACDDVKVDSGIAKVQVGKAGRLSGQIFCSSDLTSQAGSYVASTTDCPDAKLKGMIEAAITGLCAPTAAP